MMASTTGRAAHLVKPGDIEAKLAAEREQPPRADAGRPAEAAAARR